MQVSGRSGIQPAFLAHAQRQANEVFPRADHFAERIGRGVRQGCADALEPFSREPSPLLAPGPNRVEPAHHERLGAVARVDRAVNL